MVSTKITVDLLYFDGCPSYRQVWNDILDVLVEEKTDASVRLIAVDDLDRARALQFAGSPTIKGNGVMACRVYKENNGKGWPSIALLRDKVKSAI